MKKTGQNESLFYLIRGITILLKAHRYNLCLCVNIEEWNNRYNGWHTPYFPPEYQRCCLEGSDFTPDLSCDLYMFFMKYFIWMTGSCPKVNFQRNKSWIKEFRICTDNWNPQLQEAVIDLISLCISKDPNRRVQNAMKLVEENSFRLLAEQTWGYDFEKKTFQIRDINTTDKWKWKDIFLFD